MADAGVPANRSPVVSAALCNGVEHRRMESADEFAARFAAPGPHHSRLDRFEPGQSQPYRMPHPQRVQGSDPRAAGRKVDHLDGFARHSTADWMLAENG